MSQEVIKFENISKKYRLGSIGGGTLKGDLQSLFARMRGKEDPNSMVGMKNHDPNEILWALKDVSFSVNKGDAIGIIGKNGAGKSTLLKILSRVTAPTSGQITYTGRIASMMEVGTGFHGELTGRENVYLNGAILGMTKKEVDSKFDEIVEFAELEKFIDTPVKRYSSGMYVKLGFSVAAHLNSEIMVMDEVLAVGDVVFQQKCLQKMSDVAKNEGKTVLYVSHNMNTIKQLCNRCVVLQNGELTYDGDVDEAISQYVGNTFDIQKSIDLSEHIRRTNNQSGMKMIHAEILSNDTCVFSRGEKVTFRLDFESEIETDGLYLRAIIKYKDDTPAGSCDSKTLPPIHKGMNSFVFSISTENLINGRYAISLILANNSPGILRPHYDRINYAIPFEISDLNTTNISHSYWGHARFDDIIVLE